MSVQRSRNPNLALAIALISILSVINSFLSFIVAESASRDVIVVVTEFLSAFFIFNFLYRLVTAGSRPHYFLREYGWLDLLCCLPYIQISWVFRAPRAYITLHRLSISQVREDIRREGAEFALFIAMFFVIIIIEACSVSVLFFENQSVEHSNIVSAQDALWWAYVTISSVGYGDLYPVTTGGRLVGIVLMTAGVGIFATIAGYLAHKLLYHRVGTRAGSTSGAPKQDADLQDIERRLRELEKRQEDAIERLDRIERLLRPDGSGGDDCPVKDQEEART
jgi:voltage-gated potassium channel